jgi:hypothetical protein
MAEYLKANFDYLATLQFEDFENCNIQFDVQKIATNHRVFILILINKHKILAVNPPLDEHEFLEEFLVDKKKKKYYYSNENELPIEQVRNLKPYKELTISEARNQKLNQQIIQTCYQ